MPKRRSTLPIALAPPAAGVPLYRWLYDELRAAAADGRLREGTRLPASRDLANELEISRGTVSLAFDWLRAEGYIESRVGAGTFVRQPPDALLHARGGEVGAIGATAPRQPLSQWASAAQLFLGNIGPARAFRAHQAALDLFPGELWSRIAGRRLRRGTADLFANGDAAGYRPLREAIADYLNTMRGARCTADEVIVVAGGQDAIDFTARMLLDRGDAVCVEEPGYPGAVKALRAHGAHVHPIAVDDEGLDVARARATCTPKLIYVTPARQFALGMPLSPRRRAELLAWAAESGAWILEDDYDSEFRYSGSPLPSLQGSDRAGSVILAGTFGKVLFPALRLGYLVVPPAVAERFIAARSMSVRQPPGVTQIILADFMAGGHFARHLRRMRELYAERAATTQELARELVAGAIEIAPIEAGFQTVARLTSSDAATVSTRVAALGVETTPVARYAALDPRPFANALVLGFAATGPRELRRGFECLARVVA
jgi:GntR family transcriptional regulator/MocR family aminotransferase